METMNEFCDRLYLTSRQRLTIDKVMKKSKEVPLHPPACGSFEGEFDTNSFQIYWVWGEHHLEVDVHPDGTLEWFYMNHDTKVSFSELEWFYMNHDTKVSFSEEGHPDPYASLGKFFKTLNLHSII